MKALLHPVIFYRYFKFHNKGKRDLMTVVNMAIDSTRRNT